ncbi:hypothetical protein SD81_009195 [Tolypothrix campylonemoides VB511288]|nr:hypothetical protein SD81_009195 [Tolypothrix campylonemoides VB511288]
MLTEHRKPVCLSLVSTDVPVLSVVDAAATLSQKGSDRFYLLLTAPPNTSSQEALAKLSVGEACPEGIGIAPTNPRTWWLEISPNRVIMTMQGNAQLNYRHIWKQGISGSSRYWLPTESSPPNKPISLRNFTNILVLDGHPLPRNLRVEYELWAEKVQLGHYILNLEIQH